MPIYGPGTNHLPCIHALDLLAIVRNVLQTPPPVRYLVAVDDAKLTLAEVATCVSQHLGPGRTVVVPAEDALLDGYTEQAEFDQLTVDLQLDAGVVAEMEIEVGG